MAWPSWHRPGDRDVQSRPLPFFERASRAFAEAMRRKKPTLQGAIDQATKQFLGDDFSGGDSTDGHVRLLYPHPPDWGDPATSESAAVAEAVFGPLLQHRVGP